MPNRELDFPLPNGRAPLPGFRLRRLEMLNWGTFHEKVAVLIADGRWTLLVGENGSGKSTAVDALRTLLVPPRSLNYNDTSADQKKRGDRTRPSYIRGAWATLSQEDSAKSRPEYLRNEGVQSILLAVFANEHSGEVVTLVQILWLLNGEHDERFAIARADKTIKDDLANLGQTRELMRNLRQRGFEPFDSFSAYSKTFCSRLGIASEAALEVFNQAIGVKEIGDINHFIRRHMLEGSDATDFIHNRLRPHFNELDACWKAIEKAQNQLDALQPIADAHQKSEEAKQKREHLQNLLEAVPPYYAHRHLKLRRDEAVELAVRLEELREQKQTIEDVRKRDEAERDAKLQEIAAESADITRIEAQMSAVAERQKSKRTRWDEFANHLRTLNRLIPVESPDQFDRVQSEVSAQQGLIKGNRDSAQDKQVQQLLERQRAVDERARVSAELETLRKNRVLIPRDFVAIREQVCSAAKISPEDLPFAGELIEVRTEHREWTGAIERLLHQFGVSLLVPERHYIAVANFINRQHLGLRFTFHRVPSVSTFRAESLDDTNRVPGRLNFRNEHPLIGWVKSEVSRRFNHVCCVDVNRLKEIDYGITREGLIRDGPTRHTKDDRRAVNDATNFVLGWSIEDKIRALTAAFKQAEKREEQATTKAAEAAQQVKKLDDQLAAIQGVLAIAAFADIDYESEKREFARLKKEKDELEASSDTLKALRRQLDAIKHKLELSGEELERTNQQIWTAEAEEKKNKEEIARLDDLLKPHARFDPEPFSGEFTELQETAKLTLKNVVSVEAQVSKSIDGQMSHQTRLINEAEKAMLPLMANFLRDYPEHSANLRAESQYSGDFTALRVQIDREELPQHKQRFEEFLGTNLIGDMAMFQSNLLEHEKDIGQRVKAVNEALLTIPFSDATHVQIVAQSTRADDIRQFRARLKECLRGGLQPTADDRLHIFKSIRELISDFEKDQSWTRHVTDARNWFEFGVRELTNTEKREVNYFSASSGKSSGQKAKLAFTILASAITAQYGLLGTKSEADTFRLVVIDEVFATTDEANSHRALKLFQKLGLQLVVVNPFDAKGRIVEDYVDSFHLVVNPNSNNSKLRRASRAEYDAAVDGAATQNRAASSTVRSGLVADARS